MYGGVTVSSRTDCASLHRPRTSLEMLETALLQKAASLLFLYLIKEDLADIRGEMAQGGKRFAEDFQEAVLHCKQCFLLCCL